MMPSELLERSRADSRGKRFFCARVGSSLHLDTRNTGKKQYSTKKPGYSNNNWLVVWNMNMFFPFSWELHNPN